MIDSDLVLDPLLITALLLVATAFAACAGLLIALLGLQRVFSIAPCLEAAPELDPADRSRPQAAKLGDARCMTPILQELAVPSKLLT